MKKIFSCLIGIFVLCFLTSCGCDTTTNNDNVNSNTIQQTTTTDSYSETSSGSNDVISSYQPPAEVFNIDLSEDDPSNDNISFTYDSDGRITNCKYTIDNIEYNQRYTYDDSQNKVTITTYSNSTIVNEKVIDLSKYNSNELFYIVDGYYINKIDKMDNSNDWKQLYLDYIDSYVSEHGDNKDSYNIIFVNDDEMPELIICGSSHVTSTYFCWVYNNKLYHQNLNWAGSNGVTYIERKNLLRDCSNWQGSGQDTIYNFNGKDIEKIYSGTFDTILNSYTWEDKIVSETEYNNNLNAVFDVNKAKSVLDNPYTKDEIIEAIMNY